MIYIGKVVSTHGIKGEIKILSNYKFKNKVFKIENKLIIDNEELIINSYRVHKNYDMVTFKDINNINDVLKYMNKKVYVNSIILDENEYDDSLLINMEVIMNNKLIGIIKKIEYVKSNNLLLLDNNILIPYNNNLIENIDFKNKKVYIINMEGLIE